MVATEAGRVALMAIRPQYSQAIMCGAKTVEFRRRPLAADVKTVLVYETAPTQRIVGEFTVGEVVIAPPDVLWKKFHAAGGVSREAFIAYYVRAAAGAAITITAAKPYEAPIKLADLDTRPSVPQSFCYLNASVLTASACESETAEAMAS